jgi:hypothetical protein
MRSRLHPGRVALFAAAWLAGTLSLLHASPSPQVTIELRDFVAMPVTGRVDGRGQTDGLLARVNSLREEPGGATRLFVNDLNGVLYILDKATKTFTPYLDFNGRDGRPGLFHKLGYDTGFAGGLVSVQFDPDYRNNGRFYTVHIEDPALPGSNLPDNAHLTGLKLREYATTAPSPTPGDIQREGVLIEWTDTDTSNAAFEGTAREVMRVALNTRIQVQITDTLTNGTVVPTYPVIQYGHVTGGGDAVGSGVVYRGRGVPALRGKYIFTDISTGHVWFADYRDMLAADDGNPQTFAAMHEVKLRWTDPRNGHHHGPTVFDTMMPIVRAAYFARGGQLPDLPGRGAVSGVGRADVHVAVDAAGELYILSKSDGMIRAVVGAAVK